MSKKKQDIPRFIKTKMDKYWEEAKKEWEFFEKKAKEAIKHPHFEYACIDNIDRIIYIKIKPFWKWFSGKKLLTVKIHKLHIDNSGWLGTTNKSKDYHFVPYGKEKNESKKSN